MSTHTSAQAAKPPAGKRGVIDQLEGDLATIVFDDNEQLVIARNLLPANARSGDVVMVNVPAAPAGDAAAQSFSIGAATPSIEVRPDETAASQKRVRDLLDDIFKQ
jgi:hypothetical protein